MAKHYLCTIRVLYGELKELQKTYSSLLDLKTKEEVVAAGGVLVSQLLETGAVEEGALQEQIDWKKSIKKYTIECLECGALFKQLSVRHLREHDLDARTYWTKNGIPKTQPLSAKDTTTMRKKIFAPPESSMATIPRTLRRVLFLPPPCGIVLHP